MKNTIRNMITDILFGAKQDNFDFMMSTYYKDIIQALPDIMDG